MGLDITCVVEIKKDGIWKYYVDFTLNRDLELFDLLFSLDNGKPNIPDDCNFLSGEEYLGNPERIIWLGDKYISTLTYDYILSNLYSDTNTEKYPQLFKIVEPIMYNAYETINFHNQLDFKDVRLIYGVW